MTTWCGADIACSPLARVASLRENGCGEGNANGVGSAPYEEGQCKQWACQTSVRRGTMAGVALGLPVNVAHVLVLAFQLAFCSLMLHRTHIVRCPWAVTRLTISLGIWLALARSTAPTKVDCVERDGCESCSAVWVA